MLPPSSYEESCPVWRSALTTPTDGGGRFGTLVFVECERFPYCPGLRPVPSNTPAVPIDEVFSPSLSAAWDLSERMRRAAKIDPRALRPPPGPLVLGGAAFATAEDHGARWHSIKTWARTSGYAYLLPASIPDTERGYDSVRGEPGLIPYGDQLLDVFRAAREQSLSWDIGRRGDSAPQLRRLVESALGVDRRYEPPCLADSAATLPLHGVSEIVGFPDWLGYLGVILDEVGRHPPSLLHLAAAWAPQFIRMGGRTATWRPYAAGTTLLTWRTLEFAERERLGVRNQ